MDLKGKTAVLTGASSGLGAAIAKALVEKGTKVYGLARNMDALSRLKEELGENFIAVRMDISIEDNVRDWVDNTFQLKNIPEILINNAGAGSFGKLDEISSVEWLKMVNTNLNGMFYITSAIAALMKETEQIAHIVNIGSILGTMGRAEGAAYCTTKFGVRGFSEALFKELRFYGIKVTLINPGSIATDFFSDSGIEAHTNMLQSADLAKTIVHVLETPDNMLINELMVRPLNPSNPNKK